MSLRASVHETIGFYLSMLLSIRELRLALDALRSEPPFVLPATLVAGFTPKSTIKNSEPDW